MINQKKLKILVCSEASFLNTGFANYTRELLQRMHASKKYEIAEFASYAFVDDSRKKNIPWKFYANSVTINDPRYEEYNKFPENQFGKWRFEKVLLDFKPDVVIDVRDYWMNHYQSISPFRDFFHWIVMPTVDSSPQQESWIETYASADAVFTYSDWGAEVLKKQSNNKIKYISTVSPGIDLNIFKSYDNDTRKTIKKELGIEDKFIIGSVMRNQKRKLLPELMLVFKNLLDALNKNNHNKKNDVYLWLHTSYPDAGWDIPLLLKNLNIFDKTLFTYFCRKCKNTVPSKFIGAKASCNKCGAYGLSMTSVTDGPSQSQMCDIYNCFDAYIQYAICEGFGMPQVEASACGNPIATVDYSAMIDIINKLQAKKIKVKQEFTELETKAIRVYPDNADAERVLLELVNRSDKETIEEREKSRLLTEKYYDWKDIYTVWESYLDALKPGFCSKRRWNEPAKYLEPIPDNLIEDSTNDSQNLNILVNACMNHLQDTKFLCSTNTLDMLSFADYGFCQNGMTLERYSIKNLLRAIQTKIYNINTSEKARTSNVSLNEDFIQKA